MDNLGLAGDTAFSNTVLIQNRAPSISSVSISNPGNNNLGDTLTAVVSGYSDPDATPIGYYFYNWFNCSAETICNSTASGTASTYTISEADSGKFIKLYVNPVDSLGEMGTALNAIIYVKESTPPVVSDPQIYITAQSANSVSLKWNSATDNLTPASQLKYRIFYSTIASEIQQITNTSSSFPNLQTAIVGSLANPIQLTGLSSETVYYFRVMAEDNDGNRTLYNTRSVLVSNNLMAYLPFDGDIANKSSVALTTTSYGGPGVSTGYLGTAYSFNGSSHSIALAHSASLKPSQLTVSAWVNTSWSTNCRSLTVDSIISLTESSGYALVCKGEMVDFSVHVGGSYKSVQFNKKSLSAWNKLTGTYDGTNLKLYLNGILMQSIPLTGDIYYKYNNAIQIGSDATVDGDPDLSRGFTGLIDEVMIYNRALSEQEIKADVPSFAVITNQNSNSVGSTLQGNYLATSLTTPQFNWLRCDTSSGGSCIIINGATTTSYTLTTADTGKFIQFQVTLNETIKSQLVQIFNFNQNLVLYMPLDGTITEKSDLNNPLVTSIVGSGVIPGTDRKGQTNGAYSFNGNGYISVQNNQKIQLSNNLTISAWVKANQFKSLMGIVSKYISPFSSGYILRFWNSQFDNSEMRSPNIYNTNTWYHVVATISSGNVKKLYVDGTFVGSGTEGIVVQASSDPIHIGNDYSDGTSRYMNGSIDEIRIYNKELTATEVLNLYNFEK
jgi:hypothetical protein